MQQELLLEFLCEEIPARLQKKAIKDSIIVFTEILNKYKAIFSKVESYISPRRITLRVKQLVQQTDDISQEIRGPKISATESAINGFLRSNKKTNADLVEKEGHYYIKIETEGIDTKSVIPNIIEDFIENMPWKKSMRWYLENQKTLSAFWIRPIRSILCIYDGAPINAFIKSVGLTTCDHTFGHRFLSSESIRVFDFDDYSNKLEKNYVMLDFNKKREYINREVLKRAAGMGMCLMMDEELVDEVAGLVEYPFIHIGMIDEKFMKLPPEVLSTSMKIHQKYFTLMYPDSIISPFYGTVTNIPGTEIMHLGLDRVLRARLSDAMFFYKEDTDVTLEAFAQRLSNVVFHDKLGTVAQKIDRMMSIANTKEEHRTAALCKADLMTQMVGEFPELQGIIGEIYAKIQEEEHEVCVAIREHYKPIGAGDTLPITITGARISFFDKLDTVVGFLGVGVYPTGSKDPFAIRRAALSIVRLLSDFQHDILDNETLSWYIDRLITSYSNQGIALEPKTPENVKKFLADRLKGYIADKLHIDPEIIDSSVDSFESFDFSYKIAIEKAKKMEKLSQLDEFSVVKEAYKRAIGIIGEKNTDLKIAFADELQFSNDYMKNLQYFLTELENNPDNFDLFLKSSNALLNACDNVLINDSDHEIKTKNLKLINKFVELVKINIGKL